MKHTLETSIDRQGNFRRITTTNFENKRSSEQRIFELFHEYVVEYKTWSENQATIEQLSNEDQLLNLLLIKYKKTKQINGHILVKEYQFYIETNNNIQLKYLRLHFYNDFQLAMIQTQMDIDSSYFLTSVFFSEHGNTIIISTLKEVNIMWKSGIFENVHIK